MIEFRDINSKRQLAEFLKIEYHTLTYILYARGVGSFYNAFTIPKKNGEERIINAPQNPLKRVQKNIAEKLKEVQDKYYIKSNRIVHGFTNNRSIITNSFCHRNKLVILNIDIEDFFESIHFGRVKGFFEKNKYFLLPTDVAICLANLVCYNGVLPQGSPSSPVISNLICSILDYKISKISKKYHLVYTRYADDMTFSTNDKSFNNLINSFIEELDAVIRKNGFSINNKKTRISYNYSRQEVTGLVVNKKINVKRDYYRQTRAMVNKLFKGEQAYNDNSNMSTEQVEGRLSFINQIDKYNNILSKDNKKVYRGLNAREKLYQQFLFYKYFYNPQKPIIVTEGKTDIEYIKSALRFLYKQYPELVIKKDNDLMEYKISFLNRTKVLEFLMGINQEGADSVKESKK